MGSIPPISKLQELIHKAKLDGFLGAARKAEFKGQMKKAYPNKASSGGNRDEIDKTREAIRSAGRWN